MSYLAFDQLPDPTDKFRLEEEIGTGFQAKVFKAHDLQNDRKVAVKIQPYDAEHQELIEEEYHVLRDYSTHPNLPDLYGVYREQIPNEAPKIWFVLQYCEGGTAVGLVNRLLAKDKYMKEEHIGFILHEVAKAANELHRNHYIHRDIRGSNILLTKEGEVKLCDFGLTREVDSTFGKRGTCIGSPCWMSPELVTAQDINSNEIYSNRVDVWSLGITAIELGDGKPPFLDMHPTRAMFQIVRNPPPTLFKPSNWSQNYNDFISECLEKEQENRPVMGEIIEHPFLTENLENEYALQQELKHMLEMCRSEKYVRPEEVAVDKGFIKKFNATPEKMYVEDLAAIENSTDELVLETLCNRMQMGNSYHFVGDILLSLNSNDLPADFSNEFHAKYKFKSRSENAPHIFSVSDLAYQDMMHHKAPQHVIFSGESYSGKTTNCRLFIKHLFFLGGGNKGATERVDSAIKAVTALTHAGTPLNNDSTRCSLQYHITFGSTGKLSGAIFIIQLLEKSRVSTTDMNQHNFHIFYYFYDYMVANDKLHEYSLDPDRKYRYLRIPTEAQSAKLNYVRDNPQPNVDKWREFVDILVDLDISKKNIETIEKVLAAILNIGNLRFQKNDNRSAEIEDPDIATRIADLLRLDEQKFKWSLVNYCKVKGGIAERRQYTTEEARDARDSLAATVYQRLVDWIVNKINMNLAFPRAVFGDMNTIVVYDLFGFECFHRNGLEQLMINTVNEQLQYHYNQITFADEMFEMETEGIPPIKLSYYDNKQTLDNLLSKPDGLFSVIDEATKIYADYDAIVEKVSSRKSQFVKRQSPHEISVAHYTGKIIYDTRSFVDANRDFVPPEMIESLRSSLNSEIVLMFTNQLTKSGNLTMDFENVDKKNERPRTYNLNELSQGMYCQAATARTVSTVFRRACLELLKTMTSPHSGTHFVRCIRADLEYKPRNFHNEMVQQQLKALGIMDTITARQQGYSCRISFQEFLSRYQFLAFDFDETVDVTKDNCRLLLIRLKMEGWAIGKSKVFLRYYNDEFLARLYEVQVKKIIKVQSMMRAYISRKKRRTGETQKRVTKQSSQDPVTAATTIQKAFRGYKVRQKYGPLLNDKTGEIDATTATFVKTFAKRWRAKSLFQVLLHYRAAKYVDLVNLSQQVHLYNQRLVAALAVLTKNVNLDKVDARQTNPSVFGKLPLPIRKLPFRFDQIPYFDTVYMCNPVSSVGVAPTQDHEEEPWDLPLKKHPSLTTYLMTYNAHKKDEGCQTNWNSKYDESDVVYQQKYLRDPNQMKRTSTLSVPRNDYHNFEMHSPGISNLNTPIPQHRYSQADIHQSNSIYRPFNNSGSNPGSRRSSLKKYAAPSPPPMNFKKNDASSFTKRQTNASENYMRKDFRPPNPVQELEIIGRRSSNADNDGVDEAPFNFRAMLRKTNYSRVENENVEYQSRQFNANRETTAPPKFTPRLKPTDQGRNMMSNDMEMSQKITPKTDAAEMKNIYETSGMRFEDFGTWIEEEIKPGVVMRGYAFNISSTFAATTSTNYYNTSDMTHGVSSEDIWYSGRNQGDYYETSYRPSSASSSRRNSLKNYPAPQPPKIVSRSSDQSWSKRQTGRTDMSRGGLQSSSHVQELEMLSMRTNRQDDSGDDPPFNFRAMLRKTNYPQRDNVGVEYDSRQFMRSPDANY